MRMLIRFGKKSRLRFISHLDLQRFLHMALNRTGLPIKYSEGFNPHPIMAFGSALALGWTSDYEILDVKLSAPMGRKRCEDAMRAALPVDLPVLEVKLVDDRFPSAMAQICASDYRVELSGDSARAILDQIPSFMAETEVLAMKKSKSGIKEVNIRSFVLAMEEKDNGINCRLMLTEKESLKADLLVNTLAQRAGVEAEMRVHRLNLLAKKGEELVPFMEL